jgi:exopolysaccharide biosynthesis polyprenyl glycosylphosphotransferase
MVILGTHYTLTTYEIERLEKRGKKVSYISREGRSDEEVIGLLKETIDVKKVRAIVLNFKYEPSAELVRFLTHQEIRDSIKFYTFEHFMEECLHKCFIPSENLSLSYLQNITHFSKWQYFQKRAIDYIGASLLLLFAWPFMLFAAYKIKKESPGPVLFKQKRVGLNGKEYTCLKFRSMDVDAEKDGAKWAEEDDPRIYPFGSFMRKTRIDELPQLCNILKGDMHLIGPRPERLVFTKELEKDLPYYDERHLIKPGVTGWAQVNYPYGASVEDARQKLMYDLYYIKYWNIALELKTAWKTAKVVLSRQGQ